MSCVTQYEDGEDEKSNFLDVDMRIRNILRQLV